jgi:hypothetical protein
VNDDGSNRKSFETRDAVISCSDQVGLVHYLLLEADDGQPGGALMISRLIDIIVIRTLRTGFMRARAAVWGDPGRYSERSRGLLMGLAEQPISPSKAQ